jgi:hypothetical protein
MRQRRKRKFFVMSFDYMKSGPPGLALLNLEVLAPGEDGLFAPPDRRGFPNYPEPPRFLFDRKFGRPPRDLDLFHDYSLVSDRTKAVFQSIDPGAFAFVRCDVTVRQGVTVKGKYNGPGYWLCDVVRILDALDETKSRLKVRRRGEPDYGYRGEKFYEIASAAELVFKQDVIGEFHAFRMAHRVTTVICDDVLKDACRAAGLTGIRFEDASKL